MTKKHLTLNEKASSILRFIGHEKLFEFLRDVYEPSGDVYNLLETWDTDEELDEELEKLLDADVDELKLFGTAYRLSRLADKYGDLLQKLKRKYYGFHQEVDRQMRQGEAHVLEKEKAQS